MVLQPPPPGPGSDVTQIVLPFGWFRVALTDRTIGFRLVLVRETLSAGAPWSRDRQGELEYSRRCGHWPHYGHGHFDLETTLESLAFGHRQLVGIICEHSVKREVAHAKGVLLTKETL